jgi:hypothetical protein
MHVIHVMQGKPDQFSPEEGKLSRWPITYFVVP